MNKLYNWIECGGHFSSFSLGSGFLAAKSENFAKNVVSMRNEIEEDRKIRLANRII